MGYTTRFEGSITISPPLNAEEIAYLKAFADSRRMLHAHGPYATDTERAPGVLDYNAPAEGQPGLWCQWVPTDDGTALEWDGNEKFYNATAWMAYLIEHFLAPGAQAIGKAPGIVGGHSLSGLVQAKGEEPGDIWHIVVSRNIVQERQGEPSAHALMLGKANERARGF